MKPVQLVPLGAADRALISGLRDALEDALGLTVRVREAPLDLEQFYSPERVQYNSTAIIHALPTLVGSTSEPAKTLAVLGEDLFIPILTYVFGEAELDGDYAVVSYHRLKNARYGLPPNPAVEFDRLLKEAVHELGHTFGLVHCSFPECVMHTSTYVEDIDLKRSAFCIGCTGLLSSRRQRAG